MRRLGFSEDAQIYSCSSVVGANMLQGNWVFDDHGELRPLSCFGHLRLKLPQHSLTSDFAHDLARNLGFIALRIREHRQVIITLRTEMVSSVALSAALYWLADRQPSRTMLICTSSRRPAELFSNFETVITRLVKLTQPGALHSRCSIQRINESQLAYDSHLRSLIKAWSTTSASRKLEILSGVANEHLNGRYGIVRINDDKHTFYELGPTLQIPPAWRIDAINRPLQCQPDVDYWNWVIEDQRQTLARGVPQLARIQAKIFWSSNGWSSHDYTRLSLPVQTPDGRNFCFTANINQMKTTAQKMELMQA